MVRLVVAGQFKAQLAEEVPGSGADDPDVSVVNEDFDSGAVVGAADAYVVQA